MAKRSRGSSSRPGQRRPQKQASAPAQRPTGGLTAAEEARAAELEAALVAQERSAEQVRSRGRDKGRGEFVRPAASGLLAQRASEEYTYVVRDVRRISVVGGALVGILLLLWVVRDVLNVF